MGREAAKLWAPFRPAYLDNYAIVQRRVGSQDGFWICFEHRCELACFRRGYAASLFHTQKHLMFQTASAGHFAGRYRQGLEHLSQALGGGPSQLAWEGITGAGKRCESCRKSVT